MDNDHFSSTYDICLLSHSILDVAEMLYSIENEASSAVLNINASKIKFMRTIVNSHANRPTNSFFSIEALLKPLNASLILGTKYSYVRMVEVMQLWSAE